MYIQNTIFGTFIVLAVILGIIALFAPDPIRYGIVSVTFALIALAYDPANNK